MYIISVEPLSGITPRTHSGDFENRHGELGTAAIVPADNPVVGCKSIDSALAGNGELRTVQPNPILPGNVKESL
jgi:hypothetical protein